MILGLETATSIASAAVLDDDGQLLAETTFRAARTMAERLVPVIDQLLASVDLTPADIDAVAVGLGPGSFTSLRVGIATVKGFAIGRDLDLIGVGTLEALAAAAPLTERLPVCAVIAAPKRSVYAALYARRGEDEANCLFGPELIDIEALAGRLESVGPRVAVVGTLGAAERDALTAGGGVMLPPIFGVPRAATVAWLGRHRLARGLRHSAEDLVPYYVQPSEAEVRFGRTYARVSGPLRDES